MGGRCGHRSNEQGVQKWVGDVASPRWCWNYGEECSFPATRHPNITDGAGEAGMEGTGGCFMN